uniref:S-adenosylmethionine decarboxylase proenzyme n=1 Tax=Lotharella oceanica TaxID=641309 RepID=A0A7S2XIB0_9EUKA
MESSAAGTTAFEGPEKVLEVWFLPICKSKGGGSSSSPRLLLQKDDRKSGLRAVEKKVWERMLALVKCQILSVIGNEYLDAYLLSESSMFVYPRQVVLKTCGTTTLLNAVPELLKIARSIGLGVEDVFYNRQNYFFPEKQLHPHRSFADEVKALDTYFTNGAAYIVGKLNGNHWNFYNAERKQNVGEEVNQEEDVTFELLMTGLNPKLMKPFYYDSKLTPAQATKVSGIADLFPSAIIDDYVFEPFGYSMNGLVKDGYFTIHVTPQKSCSFVSFETNIVLLDYTELAEKVLKCFEPKRFILTLMGNEPSMAKLKKLDGPRVKQGLDVGKLCQNGFDVADDIQLKFQHYSLVFLALDRANARVKNKKEESLLLKATKSETEKGYS